MSSIKTLTQNLEQLIEEIEEAILLDTDSSPFDHKKYLQLATKPLFTDEEVTLSVQNNRLRFLMAYFLSDPENTVKLYLNKEGFNEMYPYLKHKKGHPNLQVIVSDNVLQNEEKELFEQLPFQTDPTVKKLLPKRISHFKSKENILLIETDKVDIPSFGIINGYHTLIQNQEDGGFLIHFNADMSKEGEEHLELAKSVFKHFKEEMAYPYLERTPQKISKNESLLQQVHQNQNTRG